MHTTINYSQSPAPQFDAIQDIKDYIGIETFTDISLKLSDYKHCGTFAIACWLMIGIQGFPVKAWYEHINGQGTWKQDQLEGLE